MKENMLYTSVEQSKKLVELGFSTDACDMYYWCGTDIRFGGYKAWDEEADIPSWSLDLLMRILLCYVMMMAVSFIFLPQVIIAGR